MSKTAGHTATPWKQANDPKDGVLRQIWTSRNKSSRRIATVVSGENTVAGDAEAQATAAYIVTAVNSHAANLRKVEALRDALRTELEHLKVQHASARVDVRFGNKAAKPELHDLAARINAIEGALALAEEQAI